MSIKKKMVLALTAILVLSVAMGAFAATQTRFTFDGNQVKECVGEGAMPPLYS